MAKFSENIKAFESLKLPNAIIYDWDNTLVDTWPLIHKAINSTLSQMDKKLWDIEEVKNNIHFSMRDYFPQIFGDKWLQAGDIYRNSYNSINIDNISLLPNALELIKKVSDLGILQFLISNKQGVTLRKEAKKLQIEKYFFSIIGASDADHDKPHKSPVDLALMLSDIDFNKDCVWFIGDTIVDIECAYNSGCVAILYGHSSRKISHSITNEILKNGFKNNGIIPLYFDHDQLIQKLNIIS